MHGWLRPHEHNEISSLTHTPFQWLFCLITVGVDSFRPSDAYVSVNWASLVQIMACRLVGAKPLSEPVLECCWLDPWEQTPVKSQSKFVNFHSRKFIRKCRLENGGLFASPSMYVGSMLVAEATGVSIFYSILLHIPQLTLYPFNKIWNKLDIWFLFNLILSLFCFYCRLNIGSIHH